MKTITKLENDFLNAIIDAENNDHNAEWSWFDNIDFDVKKGLALTNTLKAKGILDVVVDDESDFESYCLTINNEYFNRIDDSVELKNIIVK